MKILVLILVLMISGCVQKSSEEDLKTVKLTKLYTIEGHSENAESESEFMLGWRYLFDFLVDDDGYCYIVDEKTGSIRVFDKAGKFYSSISGKGMGPEEIESLETIYAVNDTLFVLDNRVRLKKFLRSGEYAGVKMLSPEKVSVFNSVYALNDTTMLAEYETFARTEVDIEINYLLSLLDKELRERKNIARKTNFFSKSYMRDLLEPVFAFSDSEIFVSYRSKSDYRIDVYSHEGDHLRTIKNNYIRVKYSNQEMKIIRKFEQDNKKITTYRAYDVRKDVCYRKNVGNTFMVREQ